jgi:hypothetical protein
MSHPDAAPIDPRQERSAAPPAAGRATPHKTAFAQLAERLTPWVLDVGSVSVGGLLGFDLVILGSLVTIGPVDLAITVATTALALALPLQVTGLVLLRLIRDLQHVDVAAEVAPVVLPAGLTAEERLAAGRELGALRLGRPGRVLRACLGLLALGALLTVTGMTATLWHTAWWLGGAFLAMILSCPVLVATALVSSQRTGHQGASDATGGT